jgi:hypothetical protein
MFVLSVIWQLIHMSYWLELLPRKALTPNFLRCKHRGSKMLQLAKKRTWDFEHPTPDSKRMDSTLLGSIFFVLLSATLYFCQHSVELLFTIMKFPFLFSMVLYFLDVPPDGILIWIPTHLVIKLPLQDINSS